jgi:aminoglycoside phosphotransferase (APT) family kinase protein
MNNPLPAFDVVSQGLRVGDPLVAPRISDETMIGRGRTAEIYAWGEDKVIKLFYAGWRMADVEREARIGYAVQATGLPVPQVGSEVIRIGDRYGIVFEWVTGASMLKHFSAKPWTLMGLVRSFAQIHVAIHSQTVSFLPSQRDQMIASIERAKSLSPRLKAAARNTLDRLPDGSALSHGDYHPDNVLVTDRGPVVIDWNTASRGNPLADVAYTSLLFRLAALPPGRAGRWLMELGRDIAHAVYLHKYKKLSGVSQREIDAWALPVAAARLGAGIPQEERPLLKLVVSLADRSKEAQGPSP